MDPSYNSNVPGPVSPTPQPTISSGGDIFLPPSQPTMTVKKSKKPLIVSIVIIAIIALVGVVVWLVFGRSHYDTEEVIKTIENDIASLDTSLSVLDFNDSIKHINSIKNKIKSLKNQSSDDDLAFYIKNTDADLSVYSAAYIVVNKNETGYFYTENQTLINMFEGIDIPNDDVDNGFIRNYQNSIQVYLELKEKTYTPSNNEANNILLVDNVNYLSDNISNVYDIVKSDIEDLTRYLKEQK